MTTGIRLWLGARIPFLRRVTQCSQADIDAAMQESLAHKMLVATDALAGLFGSPIPFITISTRTALALLPMDATKDDVVMNALHWPLWAMALGYALERIDPGHLQSAMVADFARATYVQNHISGLGRAA